MKSRQERETVIRQSEADDTWTVFTEVGWLVRRMTKLFGPGTRKSEIGFEWQGIPQSGIRACRPHQLRGPLTEEQRQALRSRLTKNVGREPTRSSAISTQEGTP